MYMAHQLALRARADGGRVQVIGIPKTIDNDIAGTDHTPGYGSTAWFFACAVRDIGEDIRALPGRVSIVEIMGRYAGWLTAATVFARQRPDDPPHLIYLPEASAGDGEISGRCGSGVPPARYRRGSGLRGAKG